MGFETFEPLPTEAPRRVATVRFLSKGRVSFNAAASRLLSDRAFTHMRLLFDPDTRDVAFEPTDGVDKLGYKLTASESQTILTAPGFSDRYAITGIRFALAWDEEEQRFVGHSSTKPPIAVQAAEAQRRATIL